MVFSMLEWLKHSRMRIHEWVHTMELRLTTNDLPDIEARWTEPVKTRKPKRTKTEQFTKTWTWTVKLQFHGSIWFKPNCYRLLCATLVFGNPGLKMFGSMVLSVSRYICFLVRNQLMSWPTQSRPTHLVCFNGNKHQLTHQIDFVARWHQNSCLQINSLTIMMCFQGFFDTCCQLKHVSSSCNINLFSQRTNLCHYLIVT